jgi:hypothetical protein
MILVTPKPELKEFLELKKDFQVVQDFSDDLLHTYEFTPANDRFYFGFTCINTNSEGLKNINNNRINYFKLCHLAYIYELLYCRQDLLIEIFGNIKFSVDFFDQYWLLLSPFDEIKVDSLDEIFKDNNDLFVFPDTTMFDDFLSRLDISKQLK